MFGWFCSDFELSTRNVVQSISICSEENLLENPVTFVLSWNLYEEIFDRAVFNKMVIISFYCSDIGLES